LRQAKLGPRSIGGDDIDLSIAIQIGKCRVARGPLSHAPHAADGEAAFAVVQVDELLVRRVVAREHIEVTVGIDVCQRRCVGSIRRRPQVRRHEAALPVVDQHAIEERRVPSLRKDDVEITIAVKVAQTHVCRILRRGFEIDDGVEAAQNYRTLSGHHNPGQYDDANEPRHGS
jgi:hypothetical protein